MVERCWYLHMQKHKQPPLFWNRFYSCWRNRQRKRSDILRFSNEAASDLCAWQASPGADNTSIALASWCTLAGFQDAHAAEYKGQHGLNTDKFNYSLDCCCFLCKHSVFPSFGGIFWCITEQQIRATWSVVVLTATINLSIELSYLRCCDHKDNFCVHACGCDTSPKSLSGTPKIRECKEWLPQIVLPWGVSIQHETRWSQKALPITKTCYRSKSSQSSYGFKDDKLLEWRRGGTFNH